jgi:endonuclease/exonuclease/phosphatase family metal-dependent hydrolase
MRLATFNLLHGRSLTDGLVDAGRLRAAVAGLDADVLGIQEVDRNQPRSAGLHLTAEVAAGMAGGASTGGVAYRFAPAVIGTPGIAWRPATEADEGGGEPAYGIGLASRWPVRSWHVLRLPASRLRSPVVLPGTRTRLLLLDDEPRVVLAAVVDSQGGPMTVATTHLSFVPGWNVRQLRRALAGLAHLPAPRVLLGDLNMPAWAVAAASRWRMLARVATYPTQAPRIQFDHALADPAGGLPRVVGAEAPPMPLSDHRALVVTVAHWAAPAEDGGRSGEARHA